MVSGLAPVLVLAYRRPEKTAHLLRYLSECGCDRVFVACDGPKKNDHPGKRLVDATVDVILRSGIPAERCLIRKENLGGPHGAPEAIDWFFENVMEGIILDDDLLPDESFFRFSSELLERYRSDLRVSAVQGWSSQLRTFPASYYFSRHVMGWGWATWRNRWKDFDRHCRLFETTDHMSVLEQASSGDRGFVDFWAKVLKRVYGQGPPNWDYRWMYTNFVLGRVAVTSAVNLVDNIGFEAGASNTATRPFYAMPRQTCRFPLRHPPFIERDRDAEIHELNALFLMKPSTRPGYWARKTLAILGDRR